MNTIGPECPGRRREPDVSAFTAQRSAGSDRRLANSAGLTSPRVDLAVTVTRQRDAPAAVPTLSSSHQFDIAIQQSGR